MKIGYFGGTFDPVHNGHLAIAKAAADGFGLQRVLFVPSGVPPHKAKEEITPFVHRYAMVGLALAEYGDKRFAESLLEGSTHRRAQRVNYSVETIRRLKQEIGARDKIFFIIGADAFLQIAQWRKPEELLRECEFIVVSRPGYSLNDVLRALPRGLGPAKAKLRRSNGHTLKWQGVTIHLLQGIKVPVSATGVRAALKSGSLAARSKKMVPRSVAEYIKKEHLYEAE